MSRLLGLRYRLRGLLRRDALDAETAEELAFHLERQARKHVAAGLSPAAAMRRARLELGGVERWREATADLRPGRLLHDLAADVRYALRGLRARPGYTLSALATLAIGIGASTAIFGIVDGALLRPLPFRDPGRIMSVVLRMPMQASQLVDMVWSYPKFALFRERQTVFASLALHSPETVVVAHADGAERVPAEMAGASYFEVLGVRPLLGRTYTPAEDRVGGASDVVVVGEGLWRTRLGADPRVVGVRALTIDGVARTIVGVLPAGFGGLSGDAQLWIPVPAARSAAVLESPGAHNMQLVARLRPGVAPAAARAAVAAIGAEIDAAYPDDGGHWSAAAYELSALRMTPSLRRSLQLLGLGVALLLAIVCVNLTMLLLVRGTARRQELAVRLALGGSRGRLVRQLATESLVLAALGSVLGLGIAVAGMRLLASKLPLSMPTTGVGIELTRLAFTGVGVTGRTLGFGVALTLLTGLCLGVASALRVAGRGLVAALRQGSASSVAPPSRHGAPLLRGGLVTLQVALAVVFLVVSGLTLRSLQRALAVPLGYEPDGLLLAKMTLDPVRARPDSTGALWQGVVDELRRLPGVRAIGIGSCAPVGMHCDGSSVTPQGHAGAGRVLYLRASPEYFSALRTPVLRGRAFEPGDTLRARPVMLVNRTAARTIWGTDDPLVTPAVDGERRIQVVGVVEDARYEDLERPAPPTVYVPFRGSRGVLLVRTDGDPAALAPAVRQAVRRAGAGHALGEVQTMRARLRDATVRSRLGAQVLTAFAASALLLAAVGVYGTLALRVTQRTRELAIRRALGASAWSLAGLVGRQAVAIAVVGGVGGTLAALAAGRGVAALLYDVRPLEPSVYVASGLLLLLAVLAAAAVPTRRSLRVDPREAMHAE
ncbi:MAG TPA: ADOP family duplicated permease [Gemmatimonadaceae bacterium]|nr:ADOP family duplicated permease [Gemmatimonadaceae bacterium]